jgi:hypothetical protein
MAAGTTSPANGAELGIIAFSDSSHSQAAFMLAKRDGGTWTSGSSMPSRLEFSTCSDGSASPSERVRINASGQTLVGTSDAGQASGTGIKLLPTGQVWCVGSSGDVYSHYNGGYKFYVSGAGVVNATSGTITVISDQRFKENIRDLDDGLAKVLALQPRKFDWKEGRGSGAKDERGFIAQEFEQVFPDLISEWKDEAPEGEEPYKAVRADLIPVLVKAIQEQQALITELQSKVAALEGV